MKRTSLSVAVALMHAVGSSAQEQNQPASSAPAAKVPPAAAAPRLEFPALSPAATLKQRVGLTDITIVYSRPSMRGRKIFGGLLPYGEVWRTGANTATRITFSTPVKFGGADLAAGAYELFTIPGPAEWTVILQKLPEKASWGAYTYDRKNDTARIIVKPVATGAPVETFGFAFDNLRDESATLNLAWENTRVPVEIAVNVTGPIVAQIEAAMAADGKKPYFQAALFYLDHDLDLTKAAQWMDAASAENPDAYYVFYHKARLLAKRGDKAAAIATARKSIELAAKDTGPAKGEYTRLNEALIASLQ
jgi:Protein of unknown function (DUF2911)